MEHVKIIDAILVGREEEAAQLLRVHLQGARDVLLLFLKSSSHISNKLP